MTSAGNSRSWSTVVWASSSCWGAFFRLASPLPLTVRWPFLPTAARSQPVTAARLWLPRAAALLRLAPLLFLGAFLWTAARSISREADSAQPFSSRLIECTPGVSVVSSIRRPGLSLSDILASIHCLSPYCRLNPLSLSLFDS